MVSPSDGDLAFRAQRGDREAFGELVRRYQTSVFNVCYRLLGERRESEDLTQEVFIRAYQRFHLFDPDRPFGPWMRLVAANMCLNHLKVQRSENYSLDDERNAPSGKRTDESERVYKRSQEGEAIWAVILSLPPKYRALMEVISIVLLAIGLCLGLMAFFSVLNVFLAVASVKRGTSWKITPDMLLW